MAGQDDAGAGRRGRRRAGQPAVADEQHPEPQPGAPPVAVRASLASREADLPFAGELIAGPGGRVRTGRAPPSGCCTASPCRILVPDSTTRPCPTGSTITTWWPVVYYRVPAGVGAAPGPELPPDLRCSRSSRSRTAGSTRGWRGSWPGGPATRARDHDRVPPRPPGPSPGRARSRDRAAGTRRTTPPASTTAVLRAGLDQRAEDRRPAAPGRKIQDQRTRWRQRIRPQGRAEPAINRASCWPAWTRPATSPRSTGSCWLTASRAQTEKRHLEESSSELEQLNRSSRWSGGRSPRPRPSRAR